MLKPTISARPGFFIVRPEGQIVPLVAVDELPSEVILLEAPKSLELQETAEMTNLGLVSTRGGIYTLELLKPLQPELASS